MEKRYVCYVNVDVLFQEATSVTTAQLLFKPRFSR